MVQKLPVSFTSVTVGGAIRIQQGESLDYSLSGPFSATLQLEYTPDGGKTYQTIFTKTAAASGRLEKLAFGDYRWRCTAYTSGTAVTSVSTVNPVGGTQAKSYIIPATGIAKVGGTSGWAVAPADNISLVTLPASQTGSKLVIPLLGLKTGDTIQGFNLIGQVESGGNTATLDADLRVHTAVAADVSDASVGSMTQLSMTADTALSASNTGTTITDRTVADGETFYLLITGTTAAATDVAIQGVALSVLPA